jgi:hypothetical protein
MLFNDYEARYLRVAEDKKKLDNIGGAISNIEHM